MLLFFKAQPPGRAHPEYRVRKDGVTQRYHVGAGLPALSAPTPRAVLAKRERLLGRVPTVVDRADVPAQLLADYLAGSVGARGRAATWAVSILPREVSTMDLGMVAVTRSGIKDALYHGSGPLKLLALPHLTDLLAQAVLLRQRPKEQGRSFLVASTLSYQGEVFVARMVVEEDRNGRRFYNHEFTEIKKLEGYSNSGAPVDDYGKLAGDPQASDESIVQALFAVKPMAVLKAAPVRFALFFKAQPPGRTHPEYRVRKDGVTQRYHVGAALVGAPPPARFNAGETPAHPGAPPPARSDAGAGKMPAHPGAAHEDPQLLALLKQYAGDTEVSPEEIHEAVRQYREVEARYRGTPQWLKAPNGQPTNLNERQWVLVRTPNFKRWFGNWEGLVQQQRLDLFIDTALADPASQGTLVLRAVIPEERAEVLRQGGPDLAGMEHVLDAQELRHAMKSHGGADEGSRQPDQRPLKPDDLKRIAAVLDAPDELTVQPRQTNRTSIIYGRAFPDGKVEYVERVFETSTKHKPRLVTKTVWVKAAAGVGSSPTRVSAPYRTTSLAFSSGRINPDTVSKVMDPNGEPLVVYHGTTVDFAAFREGPAYVTADPSYAERGESDEQIMSLFAAIKRPASPEAWQESGSRVASATVAERRDLAAKRLQASGFDGVAMGGRRDVWIAFSPTQIKSAIGNAGTFRPDLGHINKAHRPFFLFFRGHR